VVVRGGGARGRVTGTDLLERFAGAAPIDLFGIDAESTPAPVRPIADLPHADLHDAMACRRVYLHPIRWTSLGLSLIEAMQLGMPVVALGTTEAHEAVPPAAGFVSTSLDTLCAGLRRLVEDPEEAAARGAAARDFACERYGLARFHADWDATLAAWAPSEVST
jgi:glycosyltransferase involved in cell wall biosynthesis